MYLRWICALKFILGHPQLGGVKIPQKSFRFFACDFFHNTRMWYCLSRKLFYLPICAIHWIWPPVSDMLRFRSVRRLLPTFVGIFNRKFPGEGNRYWPVFFQSPRPQLLNVLHLLRKIRFARCCYFFSLLIDEGNV